MENTKYIFLSRLQRNNKYPSRCYRSDDQKALRDCYGNASSPHQLGREALIQVDRARQHIAELVGYEPRKIRFTSGATESNNWVIQVMRQMHPNSKILVSAVEHPSVYELGDVFVCRIKW